MFLLNLTPRNFKLNITNFVYNKYPRKLEGDLKSLIMNFLKLSIKLIFTTKDIFLIFIIVVK